MELKLEGTNPFKNTKDIRRDINDDVPLIPDWMKEITREKSEPSLARGKDEFCFQNDEPKFAERLERPGDLKALSKEQDMASRPQILDNLHDDFVMEYRGIPNLVRHKKAEWVEPYQLDEGRWVKVDDNYVEQVDLRHRCFGLQFPFFTIDRIEHLSPDSKIKHQCPLCKSVLLKQRHELVEHVMRAHARFNAHRFGEKVLWFNTDGAVLRERFNLTGTQLNSIRRIGTYMKDMAGFWDGVEEALHFSQKAKKTLGREILDMVASVTRQESLFNILKNGRSESDAFKKATRDCIVLNVLHPGVQYTPYHLENIQIRKGKRGGSGVVKADIYIAGIKEDKLVYNEIREIRAKGGQGNRPNDVAYDISGEASACITKAGMLTKFVIESDLYNVPTFSRMGQRFSDYYGGKELHLGEWRGRIPSELREGGYATWLKDGTRTWMQVQQNSNVKGRFRVLFRIWKPSSMNYHQPDITISFLLEFNQLARSVLAYNAFAEQALIVICALCGVKREADRSRYPLYQPIWNRESWRTGFEKLLGILKEIDHSLNQASQIDVNIAPDDPPRENLIPNQWDEVRINTAQVKIRGNARVLQLVLRTWPCQEEVEVAMKHFHFKPQIKKLSVDKLRIILQYLLASHDEPVSIMKEIVKNLKEEYINLYHRSPFIPFGKRVYRNQATSLKNPAFEVLAGLRVIVAQAHELLGVREKTGKLNDGDVELQWNTLHAWLNRTPTVVDRVNDILDWLVGLTDM
jgi:hypothetical protein